MLVLCVYALKQLSGFFRHFLGQSLAFFGQSLAFFGEDTDRLATLL